MWHESNNNKPLPSSCFQIAQLVEEVQKLQAMVNKMREHNSSTIARLEEELEAKTRAFALLEDKLRTQDDYEEVKRELK